MSRYFDKFPNIKETINGKVKTLVDISYAPSTMSDEFVTETISSGDTDEVGGLSLKIYNDADAFWSLLYANDEMNPWELIPERASSFQDRNEEYSSTNLRFGTDKLNANFYVTLKEGDIIVSTIGAYTAGVTAASSLFNFDVLDTWFVSRAFYDTKKAKITKNLNQGVTGAIDIANPNTAVESGQFQVLRKGSTGYYLLSAPAGVTTSVAKNLKSYTYLKSPATVTSKISSGMFLVSAFEPVGDSDSIWSVVEDENPGVTAAAEVGQDYTVFETKYVQKETFLSQVNVKYIPQGQFSKILNKLI